MLTLDQINRAGAAQFAALLNGIYEHSPWVAEAAFKQRPEHGFSSLTALKLALVASVREADSAQQLALLRVHPELAGKARLGRALTAESRHEQGTAGLAECTPAEFERIQQLNIDYNARFGWPFILAVRGPRGTGLSRAQIIDSFERRLHEHRDDEFAECLRQVHRIAELRLSDALGVTPHHGNQVWDWAEALAQHSDPGFKEHGQLTVTYLTDAHRACARQLMAWMHGCGFDEVSQDAVGNVVGIYRGGQQNNAPEPLRLLTGSHFDTVRNAGRYDGRLGIFVPMACVQALHQAGRRLPFGIEVVGFAEEEGQRYQATFLGSGALTGHFDPDWLDQHDADGIRMQDAMRHAGLPGTLQAITALQRDPSNYLGFVEVHIEQGPVLNEMDLPLGVVTSINGSVRHQVQIRGTACHAGTTPMDRRRDAAAAAAKLILYVERRAASTPGAVGTVGMLQVPGGSINVVPGGCHLSLDLRATTDAARDALDDDVCAALASICERRGLHYARQCTNRASAAPSHPDWQARWEAAVAALDVPVFKLPSGAGHDAMKLHKTMPQAMLFMRGMNAGISHNPLESITADDTELCVRAFQKLLEQLAAELS